ncbi:trehalase family glycosidase [Sphingomonas sp. BIUV-7]|uniref:Trehalase family glycosidase n=1 Tax=Sphingomonas natans TaxID=3063330 RepID=A0ABT8Y7J0_9SPHN|nr:trehalase family glycosidase [Sphingomonas sp. BIUV-7]MDO6414273.1 trehalase family glycosidase [Sphingomonas sp. BIUV-7]
MTDQFDTDRLDGAARDILRCNDRGGYTVPNGRVYPFQWNWDSAFVALGFATFDRERAWAEIETLFRAQWDDGFLPHIVFWQEDEGYFPGPQVWGTDREPVTSGITQPPVAATVVRRLWDGAVAAGEGEAFRPRAEALFDKLFAWHRWFADHRDPEQRGVVVAMHPWETGRDNSPEWDAPGESIDVSNVGEYTRRDTGHLNAKMRPTKLEYDRYLALVQYGRAQGWDHAKIATGNPFKVADVGMSMILLRANRDLADLADILGCDRSAIDVWIARSEAGIGWLWDEVRGTWCSRDLLTGRHSGFVTSASLLSFYAGLSNPRKDAAMLAHIERISARVQFLMPSLDPDDPGFQMVRYWRGPVWAVVNWMIGTGLAEAGHRRWAERVRGDTLALIARKGFYEAFSPIDGSGSGGDDFSWTAAIWLAWSTVPAS